MPHTTAGSGQVSVLTSPCGIYPIPRPRRFVHDRDRARRRGGELPEPAGQAVQKDLIREELPVARRARPDFVTILIGANDIVQGSDEASYRGRLQQIYQAVKQLGVRADRVLAISIPDFSPLPGAAPFGSPSCLLARVDAVTRVALTE